MVREFYNWHFRLIVIFVFSFQFVSAQQNLQLSGKVVDDMGKELAGATVSIKGTNKQVSTDESGNYVLEGISAGALIVEASYVGHASSEQRIQLKATQTLNFTLSSNAAEIGEVVVIGYGSVERKHVTGAVSNVQSKDFQKGAITSPDQLIQGKVSGVSITSNGGAPGAGSTIRVRGGASLSASNNPLIVVDGNPLSGEGISGSANPLSLINPNDIESMTVLKDANATAIYGSRASNGVILITTKTGKMGRPKLNLSTVNSLSTIANQVEVLTADEVRSFVNERGTAAQKGLLGTANTDWQDLIYHNAITTDNNISLSGGVKNMPYRVSIGYLEQAGILKTDMLRRGTAGVNLSPRFFDNHLKLDINFKGTMTNQEFANTGAIGSAIVFDPTQNVYDANSPYGGYFEWQEGAVPNTLSPRNPVSLLDNYSNRAGANRSIGNAQLDYSFHFLPELHANINVGYDIASGKGATSIPDFAASNFGNKGLFQRYRGKQNNTFIEGYLNYVKDIESINSNINVTAGYGYYDNKETNYNFSSYNAHGDVITTPVYADNVPQNRLLSYYGRLIYSFADRYILSGTIRADGSSKFNPDGRWGIFPSAAFTWRIKGENFLKDNNSISDLKLRVSYGETGNKDGITNYGYIPVYYYSTNEAQYQIGDQFYHVYSPIAYDKTLRWESTATTNIGLDYGFWGGRIYGSIDAYQKKTKDLLATTEISVGTNYSNQLLTNVGNMENRGIEGSINIQAIKSENFNWDLGFNMTVNESKITNLTLNDNPGYQLAAGWITGGTGNVIQYHTVGSAPFQYYVYKQVYDQQGNPLEGVYEDLNGDGAVTPADRYYYQKPAPDYFMGFTTSINYKRLTLNTVLRASFGNYVYDNISSNFGVSRNILNPSRFINNATTDIFNTNFNNNQYYSDYYISNASFLRMDNLGLVYNVGNLDKEGTVTMTVNANVQNVFTVSKYKGVDPELFNGIDYTLYPRPRVYSLGLNFGF
ncbi:SusC/RagA family TonB-linked outer membrane protein [Sphingobacterium sp. DK4209]|uniref:SusC/RagA family TonB-linked outer membrane protein n=1 Tax=Sphingobacterium zhuxiongii TaxID=2662364 RepID=A0A5Q0QBL1_9SPHI|nr:MULTISPECIES: SusC/RagA family TonB-linked outer membrane protein [unclassified Sphingobacterium]MVZ66258.1 SusC/RagA family TonB-linked outer membrane protein [Sphingobacterium sp. DK4209]QGA24982.1 SusC/RagA family TonB-linked outer membrane protein [Sphingobacterium sp. dk4302]